MNITVTKWGNSLGIRIPQATTKSWKLENGDTVDIEIKENEIIINYAIALFLFYAII